jgi:hypothetical protein
MLRSLQLLEVSTFNLLNPLLNTETITLDNDPTSNGPNAPTAHLKSDISSVSDPSRSLLSLLTASTNTDSASHSPVIDSTVPKLHSRLPIADSPVDRNTDTTFNPPPGSRLLALGNRAPAKPVTPNSQLISSTPPNGNPTTSQSQLTGFSNLSNPILMTENSKVAPRTPSGFSPFEEQHRELGDSLRRGERTSYVAETGAPWPDSSFDSATAGHAIGRGSRFAKFFDGKGKETPISPPNMPKAPTPVGFVSSSPGPHVRPESGFSNMSNPNLEQHRPADELFAKLNMNSLQVSCPFFDAGLSK